MKTNEDAFTIESLVRRVAILEELLKNMCKELNTQNPATERLFFEKINTIYLDDNKVLDGILKVINSMEDEKTYTATKIKTPGFYNSNDYSTIITHGSINQSNYPQNLTPQALREKMTELKRKYAIIDIYARVFNKDEFDDNLGDGTDDLWYQNFPYVKYVLKQLIKWRYENYKLNLPRTVIEDVVGNYRLNLYKDIGD